MVPAMVTEAQAHSSCGVHGAQHLEVTTKATIEGNMPQNMANKQDKRVATR